MASEDITVEPTGKESERERETVPVFSRSTERGHKNSQTRQSRPRRGPRAQKNSPPQVMSALLETPHHRSGQDVSRQRRSCQLALEGFHYKPHVALLPQRVYHGTLVSRSNTDLLPYKALPITHEEGIQGMSNSGTATCDMFVDIHGL